MRSWTRCARRTTKSGLRSAGIPEGAGLAEIVAELSGLATSLQQTVDSGRTLVSDIQQLGSALKDGFENADSARSSASPSSFHAGVANWQYAPDFRSGVPAGGGRVRSLPGTSS